MNYKRALITGGAGLIGSHIADRLVAEGFQEIVVLDNLTRGRRQNLESAMASGKVRLVEGRWARGRSKPTMVELD